MNLFHELKRRKVFRIASVYAVTAWVLIQVADTVLPALQMPEWTVTFITVLFILGFVPTLIATWAYEITPEGVKEDAAAGATSAQGPAPLHPINYAIFVIVLVVAGFQIADRFIGAGQAIEDNARIRSSSELNLGVIRTEISVPEDFVISGGVDISSDGTKVVISGYHIEDRAEQLWLRRLDELSLVPIPGTGSLIAEPFPGGFYPSFSPDGESVVFSRSGRIETVSISGASSQLLLEGYFPSSPSAFHWGYDNYIYFIGDNGGIWRIPADGGDAEEFFAPLTASDHYTGIIEVFHEDQLMLFKSATTEISAASLDTGEVQLVTEGLRAKYFSDGKFVFVTPEGDLMVSKFDRETLKLSDTSSILQLPIDVRAQVSFDVSDTGTMIHASSAPSRFGTRTEFVWITRSGNSISVEPGWEFNTAPQAGWSLSPDNSQIAYQASNDIWIKHLNNGPNQRITLNGGGAFISDYETRHPEWSTDGRSLIFSQRFGADIADGISYDLWQQPSNGAGDPQLILDLPDKGLLQPAWDKSGEWLIFRSFSGEELGRRDIFAFNPNASDEIIALVANPQYAEQSPDLSPDGKWLAYSSNLSGQNEIYIRPFPDVDKGRWQISIDGGIVPKWSSTGDELFFVDSSRNFVSVSLTTEDEISVQQREVLFNLEPDIYVSPNNNFYDVAIDDERFLFARQLDSSTPSLVLVQNFIEELRQWVGEE